MDTDTTGKRSNLFGIQWTCGYIARYRASYIPLIAHALSAPVSTVINQYTEHTSTHAQIELALDDDNMFTPETHLPDTRARPPTSVEAANSRPPPA